MWRAPGLWQREFGSWLGDGGWAVSHHILNETWPHEGRKSLGSMCRDKMAER